MSESHNHTFHVGDLVRLQFSIYIRYIDSREVFGPFPKGAHAIFLGSQRVNSVLFAAIFIDGQMGMAYLNDLEHAC